MCIISELFFWLTQYRRCHVIAGIFRWPKKEIKPTRRKGNVCFASANYSIQYTHIYFVCISISLCVCGIDLSKFVSVHWFHFTADNFWFCLLLRFEMAWNVLSLLFRLLSYFRCGVFSILYSFLMSGIQ